SSNREEREKIRDLQVICLAGDYPIKRNSGTKKKKGARVKVVKSGYDPLARAIENVQDGFQLIDWGAGIGQSRKLVHRGDFKCDAAGSRSGELKHIRVSAVVKRSQNPRNTRLTERDQLRGRKRVGRVVRGQADGIAYLAGIGRG